MRPGYLQGYGEDSTRPGNFGNVSSKEALKYLNQVHAGAAEMLKALLMCKLTEKLICVVIKKCFSNFTLARLIVIRASMSRYQPLLYVRKGLKVGKCGSYIKNKE